jgi:uncharacterized phage protein (TIGR01671 family)
MRREIKFRAWNTEINHMVFPSLEFGREIWPCTYKRIIKNETDENGYTEEIVLEMVSVDHILQSSEFKVMQYIGLKDKNGIEIYEGDILKCEFVNCNFSIEYNNEAACYDWYVLAETEKQCAALANSIEESPAKAGKPFMEIVEVIGNIYENPELL